jgi:hypothetical protein
VAGRRLMSGVMLKAPKLLTIPERKYKTQELKNVILF